MIHCNFQKHLCHVKFFWYALFEHLNSSALFKELLKLTRIKHFGVLLLINKATNAFYKLSIQTTMFFRCALLLFLFLNAFIKSYFPIQSVFWLYFSTEVFIAMLKIIGLYDGPSIVFLSCFQAILLGLLIFFKSRQSLNLSMWLGHFLWMGCYF